MFYDYHLVYILATVWDTSTSISDSSVFLHTVLDPLEQSRLGFSNPKETFVRIQLLEIGRGRSFICHSILLLIFRWRFFIFLLLTSLSQLWVSLDYLWLYRTVNYFNQCCKFWCDFPGVHKFNFCCLMKYLNDNPPCLVGREISTLSVSLYV